MPVATSCPKCQKQYQLPEQFAGKTVKCKECRQDFVVGKSTTAAKPGLANQGSVGPGAESQGTRTRSLAPAGGAVGGSELARFGLDGPIVRTSTDPFADAPQPPRAGDPLGNFANDDPGFAGPPTKGQAARPAPPAYTKQGKAAHADSAAKGPFENPYAAAAANLKKAAKPKTADIQREFDRLDRIAKNHNSMLVAFLGGIGIRLLFLAILIGIQVATGFYADRTKPMLGLPDHLFYILLGVEIIGSLISIITAIMVLVAIIKLASNLYPGTKAPILHGVLYFIPLGVLFSLLVLDRQARTQLRAAGYTVGFVGVKSAP